jgi:RNA 2',3'-cyclic 3'-phosphodiesterase
MSVFLALDVDDAVRREVMTLTSAERASVKGKWLPAEKLHLTLVFLGNPTADQVQTLVPRVHALATESTAFSLHLAGAGTFVTARAPSVLWLGVGGDVWALEALRARAVAKLEPGDARREQPFRPHVTLARAHTEQALDPVASAYARFTSAAFRVTHLTLYESTHHQFRKLVVAPFP